MALEGILGAGIHAVERVLFTREKINTEQNGVNLLCFLISQLSTGGGERKLHCFEAASEAFGSGKQIGWVSRRLRIFTVFEKYAFVTNGVTF